MLISRKMLRITETLGYAKRDMLGIRRNKKAYNNKAKLRRLIEEVTCS